MNTITTLFLGLYVERTAFIIIPITCLFLVIIAFFSQSQIQIVNQSSCRHVHKIRS